MKGVFGLGLVWLSWIWFSARSTQPPIVTLFSGDWGLLWEWEPRSERKGDEISWRRSPFSFCLSFYSLSDFLYPSFYSVLMTTWFSFHRSTLSIFLQCMDACGTILCIT
ncbi:hypothetical protein N658DRAFT_103202 [Parathielavia hyrcaniae]|uniref:Secreted protein n=1 Tax=Parathielavia hyrcaniae TaxID=113614 RepID=A0AAN6T1B2_9PEZI|nr:hypothetical protein N658DRAFT_103202 [Parathielavia hyrcaniae]